MKNHSSGRRTAAVPVSRRRVLSIIAGGATALLAGKHASAHAGPHIWEGTALGAPARLVLYGVEPAAARTAVIACLDEVERLEGLFSLYRPDSALSRLNRQECLETPALDLVRLLALSSRLGHLTEGAFDVTVQPIWQAYADYFAEAAAPGDGPPESLVAAARDRVSFRRLRVGADRIVLDAGMAVTLNGIAQGYITDQVADLLRRRGWSRVLVDMGEIRVLGDLAEEGAATIAVAAPPGLGGRPIEVAVADGAVATSAGYATVFEPTGRAHHLFSPQTGRSAASFAQVTVTARRATLADALSTALYVLPPERIPSVLARFPGATAYLTDVGGEVRRVPAG